MIKNVWTNKEASFYQVSGATLYFEIRLPDIRANQNMYLGGGVELEIELLLAAAVRVLHEGGVHQSNI